MADLTQPVYMGGFQMNTMSLVAGQGTGSGLYGCAVHTFDYSNLQIRQFTEPKALAQGLDLGGVWLGARLVAMAGEISDVSRGACYDRLASLEAVCSPLAFYSGRGDTKLGYGPLYFWTLGGGGLVLHYINMRPDGLRWVDNREKHGGKTTDPLTIQWTLTGICADPAIY
jgi:hypothetical protein